MSGLFSISIVLPIQLSCLVLGNPGFEEVLLLRHVDNLRHPGERVVLMILPLKPNALKPAVGDMLNILLYGSWGQAHNTARERVVYILFFKLDTAHNVFNECV